MLEIDSAINTRDRSIDEEKKLGLCNVKLEMMEIMTFEQKFTYKCCSFIKVFSIPKIRIADPEWQIQVQFMIRNKSYK